MKQKLLKDTNLYIIFFITLFAILGVSSLAPAFPVIISHFGLNDKQIVYLITAFTLPGIVLTPVMGILADRFGRKTILVPSMVLFGLAGMMCAFQNSYSVIIVLRFFQGVGAASLGSLNVTLIGDLYVGEKRGKAMGYNASVLSIGTATFPAIGGLLSTFDWRYIFYLCGFIFPLAVIVQYKLRVVELVKPVQFKVYLHRVWATINRKPVWGLFISNVLAFVILYGAYLSFFPLLLKQRFLANPLVIGGTMSLMSVTTALVASQYGKIVGKIKAVNLLYVSSLLYALSLICFLYAYHWILILAGTALFGLAHGSFIPNIQTLLVGMAPASERAAFMSVNGMVLRIGQTIGPLIAALFYINNNMDPIFLMNAALAVLMIVVVTLFVKNRM